MRQKKILSLALLLFTLIPIDASAWMSFSANWLKSLRVLAGSPGTTGYVDGTGAAARFNGASGINVDNFGNIYVADPYNNVVRKVTPAGVVSTLAGLGGSAGYSDGTGTAARFNFPGGITTDASGNVFIADMYNHVIRKITPAGVVSTFAGVGGSPGSTDGTGSGARFNYPSGINVDSSGNFYVTDAGGNTIRKITAAGAVTTLAGSPGSAGSADGTGSGARFNNPAGVAVAPSGDIYITDFANSTVRKVTQAGVVTTIAGSAGSTGSTNGTGSAARFNQPNDICIDPAGNLYVADYGTNIIRKISSGNVVTTVVGTPSSTATKLGALPGSLGPEVFSVYAKNGKLYIGIRSAIFVSSMP